MAELPRGFVADPGQLRDQMVTIPDEVDTISTLKLPRPSDPPAPAAQRGAARAGDAGGGGQAIDERFRSMFGAPSAQPVD
jgi:hypothetical protein